MPRPVPSLFLSKNSRHFVESCVDRTDVYSVLFSLLLAPYVDNRHKFPASYVTYINTCVLVDDTWQIVYVVGENSNVYVVSIYRRRG